MKYPGRQPPVCMLITFNSIFEKSSQKLDFSINKIVSYSKGFFITSRKLQKYLEKKNINYACSTIIKTESMGDPRNMNT